MRPSPAEVRDWFTPPCDGTTAHAYIATLRADPNWLVLYPPEHPAERLTLHYRPTGERIHLHAIGAPAHTLWQVVDADEA